MLINIGAMRAKLAIWCFVLTFLSYFIAPQIIDSYISVHSEYLFQRGLAAYNQFDYPNARSNWEMALKEQRDRPKLKYRCSETLHNLGNIYGKLNLDKLAEASFKEAIAIRRSLSTNLSRANSLNCLCSLYMRQHRFSEAEQVSREAFRINMTILGKTDIETVLSETRLAEAMVFSGKDLEAKLLLDQATASADFMRDEHTLGWANALSRLSSLFLTLERAKDSEKLALAALKIRLQLLGEQDAATTMSMKDLAFIYRTQGRLSQAKSLEARINKITKHVRT